MIAETSNPCWEPLTENRPLPACGLQRLQVPNTLPDRQQAAPNRLPSDGWMLLVQGEEKIRHFSLVCLFVNLVHILELLGVARKRLAEMVEANNTPTLFEVCLSSSPFDKVTERHIQSSLTSPLASGREGIPFFCWICKQNKQAGTQASKQASKSPLTLEWILYCPRTAPGTARGTHELSRGPFREVCRNL